MANAAVHPLAAPLGGPDAPAIQAPGNRRGRKRFSGQLGDLSDTQADVCAELQIMLERSAHSNVVFVAGARTISVFAHS